MTAPVVVPGRTSPRRPLLVAPARAQLVVPALLIAGFVAAVVLRMAVGGPGVARSGRAGLVFAVVLAGLAIVARRPGRLRIFRSGWRGRLAGTVALAGTVGLVGAAVLCVPAVLHRLGESGTIASRPAAGFIGWAVVVTVVASAEEAFLRGTLYRCLEPLGKSTAIAVPAIAFALLHLPLYGWGAVPLDLAVGVWLGALRAVAGSAVAPGVAHVVADWAAWAVV